jgi:seryl-tRNA synthetase
MLNLKFIRENEELVRKGTADKQRDPTLVDTLIQLDNSRRKFIAQVETLRAERNTLGRDDIEKGKQIKEKLKEIEPELKVVETKLDEILKLIPNPPAPDVKPGRDESENDVIKTWGKIPEFSFRARDHLELGERLGIIDVERAGKVAGSRFAYLKGDGVFLEFALVRLALETLSKYGFTPVVPPVLISRQSMAGMGYLEHGGEEDMYSLPKDDMFLVGTSEQSIGPMHGSEVLAAQKLPLRYCGFSTCFRREAGSYGKDTRGIIRVHQFDKVEMFSFVKPEDGDKEHEFLLSIEEELIQKLGLPYQVVKMCSGDLGNPAARKYDIEVWMPGQGKYRELTSTSTTTDYQSERLNIKYREEGKLANVHTLNGTAFAIGRTIVAILENYQDEDGSVIIPDALSQFMGKDKIEASTIS